MPDVGDRNKKISGSPLDPPVVYLNTPPGTPRQTSCSTLSRASRLFIVGKRARSASVTVPD